MRLIATALIVISTTIFSQVAKADDTSPELQVLDRFVGTWDVQVTIKSADGEEIKIDVDSRRRWTRGGTFLQIEDANNLKDPQARELQILWTYDPVARNYPAVIMDGPNRAQLTGTWDAKTTTMHWKGKGADGVTSEGKHRFIGKDRAEASGVFKDADGKVVMEISWPQTRRSETAQATNMTVDEIVAKHLEAIGGVEAHEKLKTRQMEGTLTIGDQALKMTITQKSPDKVFARFVVPGAGVVTEGCDGKSAWKKEGGVLHRIEGPALAQKLWDARFHKNLELVTNNKLTYRKKETVKGKDCHVLRFTTDDNFIDICIDAKTHLMNEYRIGAKDGKASEYMAIQLGDYRKIDRIQFAFSIDVSIGADHTIISIKLDEVTHGADVADALFEAPGEKDEPKSPADAAMAPGLQVLDRFVGTWEVESTTKRPGEEPNLVKVVETRKWSLWGNSIHIEHPGADSEFHELRTYDPNTKTYLGVIMVGPSFRNLITGTWEEKTQAMKFDMTFENGNKYAGVHRFIDKDHVEYTGKIIDVAGEVVKEMSGKRSRLQKELAEKVDTLKRSPELQVLDRFLGTWDSEVTIKKPGEKATSQKYVSTPSWSRGGHFLHRANLQAESPAAPGEFHHLLTYESIDKGAAWQQRSFLGTLNTSALSLHKIEADRFAASRLIGKLANICPDLPSEHLTGTSTFKLLTGGDVLTAEYKFRDSFDFTPFARLVFSANNPPRSQDSSEGFFERWIVIPFDGKFRGTRAEIPKPELDARLSTPAELSGLLNRALDAREAVVKRNGRLHTCESIEAAHREFYSTTDPLAVWLDRFTIDDLNAVVTKQLLRASYGAYCEQHGQPRPTEKAFTQALMKHRDNIDTAQRTLNGKVQWCYVGLGLRSDEPDDSQLSQDSQVIPNLLSTSPASQDFTTNRVRARESDNGEEKEQSRTSKAQPVKPVNVEPDVDWGEL